MSYKKNNTIKYRLIRLYVLIFAVICLLITAYSWQIVTLEKKITTLEKIHDLFDNVLELRRYEKNLLLEVGAQNLESIEHYLKEIDHDIAGLNPYISLLAGNEAWDSFRETLSAYKATFIDSCNAVTVNPKDIRDKGKKMSEFAENLLALEQARVRGELKRLLYSYIVVTGSFFFVVLLIFRLQVKSILQRVSFLQKATKDLVNDNFTPINDSSGRPDEISALIQAFNKMAVELNSKQDQLIQSRKLAAIGTFSSGIAHEMNNPLNNISLSADILLEDYDDLDEEAAKKILADIISQVDRVSDIVRNLLDFAREKKTSATSLNVKEVVNATTKLIANQLRINAIWLEDYIPEDLPLVNGDFQKLEQVFLNLFVNAIHAMPEGGLIYLEAKCEPDGFIRINVGDTGHGIDSDYVGHIFDPFYTTKKVGKGTGLGLSIVYGIVKEHGGYVEVKSKLNVGTTFSIFLPIFDELAGSRPVSNAVKLES